MSEMAQIDPTALKDRLDAAYEAGFAIWRDAEWAAALTLIDPAGLGGICITAPPGPVRDAWLDALAELAPYETGLRTLPLGASEERLIGGVSIERSLQSGELVAERGLLAEADGQLLVVRMADRLEPESAAIIAAALDDGHVAVERPGTSRRDPTRFAAILLDEGEPPHEAPPDILLERLAFRLDLTPVPPRATLPFETEARDITRARRTLDAVETPDHIVEAVVQTATALGVASMRVPLFCLRAARASAALAGRYETEAADAQLACRLVLASRGLLPQEETPPTPPSEPPEESSADDRSDENDSQTAPGELQDMLIEAVRNAALASALALTSETNRRARGQSGKAGRLQRAKDKGRAERSVPARSVDGARVDLIATLRAAAPWQKLRPPPNGAGTLSLRREDLRVKRYKHRAESSVIFVVDASGSAALNRMAEAKGAVEHLLSDCYARRDHVALITFRGQAAELALPPTRSLVRVRRSLAGLPAGGTTPLASGIAAATALAEAEAARGRSPFIVFLSDGRGNVALNGSQDREAAEADASRFARQLRALGHSVMFFDTSRRPAPRARALSDDLGAAYRPLPYADSLTVSRAVRETIARR